MNGTTKLSYLVYNLNREAFLGYKKMDEYTLIGAGWFDIEARLFFEYDWGAQVVDVPIHHGNYVSHNEFLVEVANLVFVNQQSYNQNNDEETFADVVCVPADITNVNNRTRIKDLEPDFFNAVPFGEIVGVGEVIDLRVDPTDHKIKYMLI